LFQCIGGIVQENDSTGMNCIGSRPQVTSIEDLNRGLNLDRAGFAL